MPTRYPVAYVRRSSADANDPGDVSREAQEAAVREAAHREGHNGDVRLYDDWNRSADAAKEGKRAALNALVADIEAGHVSAVYAYALDRLYRSMRTFVRLTDAAKAHDVRIVTAREGVLGGDGSPMAQAFAQITAVFSELELNTTKARAAGALAVRRERGDHIGRVGYGYVLERNAAGAIVPVLDPTRPLEPILEAVREAGSILGACKLLNERGVPPPQGRSAERRHRSGHWHPTPLRKIVERNAPELLPPPGPTHRRQPSSALLAQLLVCHCGHVLTPEGRRTYGQPAYRCTVGNRTGREAHGPLWVREADVLPWIKAEADRLVTPGDLLDLPEDVYDDSAERAALTALRGKVADAVIDAGLADLDERRAARGDQSRQDADVPPRIDWDWKPETINGVLRAMFRRIELGPDLRPIRAEWTVPHWRAK